MVLYQNSYSRRADENTVAVTDGSCVAIASPARTNGVSPRELFPRLRNRQSLFPQDSESPSRTGIARETRALPSAEPGTSMFPSEIKDWANGNNATRINPLMRHVVMPLDVIEVHRLGNAIMLV